ncbi:MAG: 2-amino-4-hydroxy-6-hydroxymethyldihydropteridine diphosphokinase [Burkholderiaceae bacterium]|nr:2-amino-4-hydroxy-6-hydroxymethyldihydropteridine diphosphokinase [Burkholderiaceae bacterium]MDO9089791.1 2-amino-4-hydroxy-6-hydroxymethyldihydropteridine diphosphokinase [Burkholderiaceae bacterium]
MNAKSERAARDEVSAWIALGANLGDAAATLKSAIAAIARLPLSRMVRASSLYRSAPLDASGPDFINAVVEISTGLTAPDLLDALQTIEAAAGRQRAYRNAPRTLDLDLLLYGDARIESERLCVPHPRMAQRAFVLLPLAQIAPQQVDAALLQQVAHQVIERLPS